MKRGPLARLKDAALEKAVLVLLRTKFERYGDIRSLSVDTSGQRLSAEVWLLGDPIPIQISQARYRLEGDADPSTSLVFYDVQTSKPWLQHLIDDRFPEIKVPVPSYVRTLL